MLNFLRILFLIYLNRFRKLTYGDSSPFYFLGIIYILGIWKLLNYDEIYSKILFVLFLFVQNIILLERNDFLLLKKQFGSIKSYLFIISDLVFLNFIVLLCLLFKGFFMELLTVFALIILMPLLLFLKKINYHFKLPFSVNDPLWVSFIRRKPWMFVILIVTYFVQYQGLENKNIGLFQIASFGISYFVSQIYTEKEKLVYLKFSKKKIKTHLLETLKSNIINTLYLSIPSVFLQIVYKTYPFEFLLQTIFSTSFIFWIRYLFYMNKIMQGIIYFALLFLIFYLQKEIPYIGYIVIVLFVNLLLYQLTYKKLEKIIHFYKN